MQTLDLSELFGSPPRPAAGRLGKALDLRYEALSESEQRATIASEHMAIDSGSFARTTDATRRDIWDRNCWAPVRARFELSHDPADLVPAFLRAAALPARLCGRYVAPADPTFIYHVQRLVLLQVAERHFASASAVWEFGCGSGFNLVAINALLPHAKLVGLDWSEEALRACPFEGVRIDMLAPHPLRLDGVAVLTAGALEQLGERFGPFLDCLLAAQPAICVHIEPLLELYDREDSFDAVAIRYHQARGYLSGFLPALEALERDGRAEIIETHRTRFGSLHNEGFSWTVWRPK